MKSLFLKRYLQPHVDCSIKYARWKHPKSPLVVERKTKMLWYICLLSASKNEETQPSEITRMKREGITLTEMS